MRLALALGMSPDEVLARHDARGLAEWRAYYELEPFGQDRGDLPAAIVAYTVASAAGAKSVRLSDFMPRIGEDAPKRATGQEMLAKARAFAARFKAFGGRRG